MAPLDPVCEKISTDPWHLIRLEGRDATDFLHRLSTVDVHKMTEGQPQRGFFLTAQGKVRSVFRLWKRSSSYLIELEESPPGSTLAFLPAFKEFIETYHFAEDIEYHVLSLKSMRVWLSENSPTCSFEEWPDSQGYILPSQDSIGIYSNSSDLTTDWLSRNLPDAKEAQDGELLEERIRRLSPQVGREIDFETSPLEVGLTSALSQTKGCYPGQEVIERILSKGSPARRLVQIEIHGELQALPTPLLNLEEQPVGELTSVTSRTKESSLGLGLLKKLNAKLGEELKIGSHSQAKVLQVADFK